MNQRRLPGPTTQRRASRRQPRDIHQFLVVLCNTDPLVWRRIEVPATYTFWDLHVAIQDAMGWLDYHLHEFAVVHPKRRKLKRIGIPDEDLPEERPTLPGWKVKIAGHFAEGSPPATYWYDFGDDWRHVVIYEGTSTAEPSAKVPRCIGGARRCPPEDCGGIHGYANFLETIADPTHPEHAETLQWAGGHYDPDDFDPAAVVFDDPRERLKHAFEE
jgi:hypothetical protein